MKDQFKFEPVRTLAALQVLATAVLALIAFTQGVSGEVVALWGGVISAGVVFLSSFVRNAVVPVETLKILQDVDDADLKAELGTVLDGTFQG